MVRGAQGLIISSERGSNRAAALIMTTYSLSMDKHPSTFTRHMKVLNVNKLHREKVKTNNQTNGNGRDVGKLVEKFLSFIPTAEMNRLRITKLKLPY